MVKGRKKRHGLGRKIDEIVMKERLDKKGIDVAKECDLDGKGRKMTIRHGMGR